MDSSTYYDALLFEGDSMTIKGSSFIKALEAYKHTLHSNFKERMPQFAGIVQARFTTNRINGIPWLEYNFKGFPCIATITKFTQLETDVLKTNKKLVRLLSEM